MDDLGALAETLTAGVGDARGSLILSRDGLVLGAYPVEAEGLVKPAWVRFASLGEPERGFVQFGTEIWSFVRRGPYAAFVVTGIGVRPGLVIDQIEQVLLAAEVARANREVTTTPEPAPPPAMPLSKPRTPLHPEPRPTDPSVVVEVREPPRGEGAGGPPPPPPDPPATDERQIWTPGTPLDDPDGSGASGAEEPLAEEGPARPRAAPAKGSVWATREAPRGDEGEEEVDRFSLAREFSQLLQEDPNAADG